jgi:transcriptional regulator with XRE-family HTH domain
MTFSQLHERLRLEMWRRIQRGVVTGKLLAAQTGLRPSHISNFLHRKRNLSLASLDKLLSSQQISIQELAELPSDEVELSIDEKDHILRIPVVKQAIALAAPVIPDAAIQAYFTFPSSEFDRFIPSANAERRAWERFVGLRVNADQAQTMTPLLKELSIVLIDRHCISRIETVPAHSNLFALRIGAKVLLRFVTFDATRLLLRPYSLEFPVEVVEVSLYGSLTDILIGRVCLHISEP